MFGSNTICTLHCQGENPFHKHPHNVGEKMRVSVTNYQVKRFKTTPGQKVHNKYGPTIQIKTV